MVDAVRHFEEHWIENGDGLRIYARDYRPETEATSPLPPLVCLAGLTRNSRDFHDLAVLLSSDRKAPRRVISIDTRGRGRSDWDSDVSRYNVFKEAEDVVTVCRALHLDRAAFLGTSRGGLVIHILAATARPLLQAVILNDIGPVIGVEGLRLIQSYLSKRTRFETLEQATSAVKRVQEEAFPILTEENWRWYAEATYHDFGDGYEPDCDPAIAAATVATDLNKPLPELWDQFELLRDGPIMILRGTNSKLLPQSVLGEMEKRAPSAEIFLADGQGHPPVLHIGGIPDAISAFLSKV